MLLDDLAHCQHTSSPLGNDAVVETSTTDKRMQISHKVGEFPGHCVFLGGHLERCADGCDLFCSCLIYSTNVVDPSVYVADLKEMEGVTAVGDVVNEQEVVETRKLWEITYDQQYEKASGAANGRAAIVKPPVCWDVKKTSIQVTCPCFLGS